MFTSSHIRDLSFTTRKSLVICPGFASFQGAVHCPIAQTEVYGSFRYFRLSFLQECLTSTGLEQSEDLITQSELLTYDLVHKTHYSFRLN